MTPQNNPERIHFLDAMRSVLMTLGILLHAANVFSDRSWAIQNSETSELFNYLVEFIHYFRMPAFFILSGYFCHMTLVKYGPRLFTKIRVPRIIIPLIVTALTLNSIQHWQLTSYNNEPVELLNTDYWLAGGWTQHLWFLMCLTYYFIGAAALAAFFPKTLNMIANLFSSFIERSFGLYIFALPIFTLLFIKVSYIVPDNSTIYDLSIGGTIKYAPFFMFGALLGHKKNILTIFLHPTKLTLMLCTTLLTFYILTPKNDTTHYPLLTIYSQQLLTWFACLICFQAFYKFLNKRYKFFAALSDASYTIYLFHHIFIIIIGMILIDLNINIYFKFALLISSTFVITSLIHEYIIKKIPITSLLFNGKYR